MWTRRGLAGLIAAGAAGAAGAARAAGPRTAEAQDLQRFAETTHPRGREAAEDAHWRDGWAAFLERAETADDGHYVCGLRGLLGWFQDGHTTVSPLADGGVPPPALRTGAYGADLPIAVRAFDDGLGVVGRLGRGRAALGRAGDGGERRGPA